MQHPIPQKVIVDRVVEAEPAFLDQLHDGDGGEGLTYGGNPKERARSHRAAMLDVRQTAGPDVGWTTIDESSCR